MAPKAPIAPERKLMIQTNVCHRLIKELSYYQKEVTENESKWQKMKEKLQENAIADDVDDAPRHGDALADVKRFGNVVEESRMMVPNTEKRLHEALEELREVVRHYQSMHPHVDVSDESNRDPYYIQATTLLQEQPGGDLDETLLATPTDDIADGEIF